VSTFKLSHYVVTSDYGGPEYLLCGNTAYCPSSARIPVKHAGLDAFVAAAQEHHEQFHREPHLMGGTLDHG
jgi:hypothetical protein